MLRFRAWLLLAALVSLPARADFHAYELGMSAGLPALGNFVVGYWGGPAVFRVSGGYWGDGSYFGVQGDYGWAFDREGDFKQYACFSGMRIKNFSKARRTDAELLGAQYGFHFHGLTFQLGPEITFDSFDGSTGGPKGGIFLQLGYSLLIPSL